MKYIILLLFLSSCFLPFKSSNRAFKVRITEIIKDKKEGFCVYKLITVRKDWDMTSEFIDFCNKHKENDTIILYSPYTLVWEPVYY